MGDLLPKRIEAGDEIVLLHEKDDMQVFLNGVMRDHGVFQTVYSVWLELGDGTEAPVPPTIVTQASMTDEEWEKEGQWLHRELYEAPEREEKRSLWPFRRRRSVAIMEEDLNEEDLRAIRNGTEPS